VHLASVLGLVLLAAAPGAGLRWGGAVLGLSAALATAWLLRRAAARGTALLGELVGPRLVLVVAVAVGYLLRRPGDQAWVWTAAGLGLLAVLSETTLALTLARTTQVAVNLPGVPRVPEPPFPVAAPVWASLALVLGGALLAALAAPGWACLVLAGLVALVTVVLAVHAVRATTATTRAARRLRPALEAYQPAFAVYYAAAHGARYQLGMWLPYLERLGRPFVVVTRNASTVPVITELTSAPVVVPRTSGSVGGLDSVVVDSLKAAFYVQGSSQNAYFQRYRGLTHVWLNHGDSDKAANYSARHATYDKVFVSGQQGVERYAAHGVRVPPKKFAVVGRPQVERIEVHDEPPAPDRPRTVLYAPTWRGGRPATNYSSLPLGEEIVAGLLRHAATVVFRPHPLSYTEPEDAAVIARIQSLLRADRDESGRAHLWGAAAEQERDIPDCINAVDALVTDVSSVASDFLASGKPIAMVAVRASGRAFRQEFPMARVSYVIERDLFTLDAALSDLLGPDPLAAERRAYRRHCLGEHVGPAAAEEFLRVAGRIVSGEKV
jgi:hypothetical protein